MLILVCVRRDSARRLTTPLALHLSICLPGDESNKRMQADSRSFEGRKQPVIIYCGWCLEPAQYVVCLSQPIYAGQIYCPECVRTNTPVSYSEFDRSWPIRWRIKHMTKSSVAGTMSWGRVLRRSSESHPHWTIGVPKKIKSKFPQCAHANSGNKENLDHVTGQPDTVVPSLPPYLPCTNYLTYLT